MTTESTQPQTELGPSPANGQGQSQGHRRRRRRRKNKSSQPGAAQAQQPQVQAQAPPPAPAQPQPPASPVQQRPSAPHQGAHQSQGRKKKKFFQKGAATAAQPGNSLTAPPQKQQRKGRQKGPREFVGPMDHSYRIVNGNVADGPASTVQISNGHSGYYPDSFESSPTVAVREGSPTRIYCFIEDLFFLAKIQESARKLGVKVEFVKGDKESVAKLTDLPEAERTKLKKATSIIGFLNHLQGELKAKAIEAGCDTVMPRSAFSQSLPNLLRRYGLEEEEEYAQQPV
jgi:hypothetical protein